MKGLWDLEDEVDLNVLSSNDISAIMDTYGIEAGRASIINEINSIFKMYVALKVSHAELTGIQSQLICVIYP